jgi:hypothetical protein
MRASGPGFFVCEIMVSGEMRKCKVGVEVRKLRSEEVEVSGDREIWQQAHRNGWSLRTTHYPNAVVQKHVCC